MKRLIYGSLSVLTAVCTVFVAAKAEVFTAENQGSATSEELSALDSPELGSSEFGNTATRTAKNEMLASSVLKNDLSSMGLQKEPLKSLAGDSKTANTLSLGQATSGFNSSASYQTQPSAGFASSGLLSQAPPMAKPSGTTSATEMPASAPLDTEADAVIVPANGATTDAKPVDGDANLTAPLTPTGAPVVTPGLAPAGIQPNAVTPVVPIAEPTLADPTLVPSAPAGVVTGTEMDAESDTEFGAEPLAEEDLAQDGEMLEGDMGAEGPDADMDSDGMVGEEPLEDGAIENGAVEADEALPPATVPGTVPGAVPAGDLPAGELDVEGDLAPGTAPVNEGLSDEDPDEDDSFGEEPVEADMAPTPGLGQPPVPAAPSNSAPVTPIPPASSPVTPGVPPAGLPPAGVPSSPAPATPLPPIPEDGDMDDGTFDDGGMDDSDMDDGGFDDGGMDDGGFDDGDDGFGDESLPPVESDSAAPNQFPVSGSSGEMLIGEGFTPFQLSYLAISGGLKEEGIPGGDKLVMAYEDGDISAEDIVGAGAISNRLGSAADDEADYTKGVDRFLEIFKRDARSSS